MKHDTALACVARLLQPACNLCGGQDHRPVFSRSQQDLVRCTECDLVFVHDLPRHSAIEDRASAMASLPGAVPPADSDAFAKMKAVAARGARVLSRSVPAGAGQRLFDIGCRGGTFLNLVRASGFDVRGSDCSPAAARFAQDHYQLDVHCGDWMEAGHADGTFDVVTLFDVIEFLPDPLAEMAAIKRLMKPGGVFLLSASASAGLFSRLAEGLPRRRRADGPPALYRFSTYTLTEMAALAGYEPLRIDWGGMGSGGRFYLTARKGPEALAS